MAKRIPPTPLEIIAALNEDKTRLDDNHALEWTDAIELLRTKLRTTASSARIWLCDAVSESDGPLIGVWATGTVKVVRIENEKFIGDRVAWILEEEMSLRFTPSGERLPVSARQKDASDSKKPWVMLRTALPAMRAAIVREREERHRENAEQLAAKDTVFRSIHGRALTVIEEWLSCLDQTGTNIDHRLRDTDVAPILHISTHNMRGLFGSPGSIRLDLEGDRIEAFAELIERTREGRTR